jgi:hypothetical protein
MRHVNYDDAPGHVKSTEWMVEWKRYMCDALVSTTEHHFF